MPRFSNLYEVDSVCEHLTDGSYVNLRPNSWIAYSMLSQFKILGGWSFFNVVSKETAL